MSLFYAAKFPDGTNKIFLNWPSCEKAVKGKSGVRFKKFTSHDAAQLWLETSSQSPPDSSVLKSSENPKLLIYVDGSYKEGIPYAGWGWVAVKEGQEIASARGRTEAPALSRNIDGEIEATLQALRWVKLHYEPFIICHDYQGISSWAQGEWQAKSEIARYYIREIKSLNIPMAFNKVKGHSGDCWNERADALATEGLKTHAL